MQSNYPGNAPRWPAAVGLAAILVLSGCSDSDSDDTTTNQTETLSGVISAPNGQVAFSQPSLWERFVAGILGAKAHAAISGLSNVGVGVTVELIEVDAGGAQVGTVLGTTTTASDGSYSMTLPDGFTAAAKYVVRASGSSQSMDARVTGNSVDVDPLTDAASDLVTGSVSDLAELDTDEITEIVDSLERLAVNVDTTSLDAAQLSTALQSEADNDDTVSSMVSNVGQPGSICGTVVDANQNPVEHVRITVRDYGEWVTRNRTWTDSSGAYCVNVADGDYIVGAINFSATNLGASEWWHSGGQAYTQPDAEKVTVAGDAQTANFQLEPGGRIQGTVTDGSSAIQHMRVRMRDFQSYFVVAPALSKADGSYGVNLIPGTYTAEVFNNSLRPYASEIYDGATGTNVQNKATKITVTAGNAETIDFSLETGQMLSGQVKDANTTAVAGTRVLVNVPTGIPSARFLTRKDGSYRVWLQPGTYDAFAYGQQSTRIDMTTSNQTVNFIASVGHLPVKVVDSGGNPVSRAKVIMRDTSGSFIHLHTSADDGTLTLQSDTTQNVILEALVDSQQSFASSIYNGKTRMLSGDQTTITVGQTATQLTFTLPDAGVLTGTVYDTDGTTPVANALVQVRSGGLTGADRFVVTRTRSDGTYTLSVPAGTYDRVFSKNEAGSAQIFADGVSVTAGTTTTQDLTLQ